MKKQKGFILFLVMIFLVIMSLLGVSMFNGFTQDQKTSGNLREKDRAIEVAQTGLDAVQYWLAQPGNAYNGGNWVTGYPALSTTDVCATTPPSGTTPIICATPLTNPATSAWASATTSFTPDATYFTLNPNGGAGTYASNVKYYVQFIPCTGLPASSQAACTGQTSALYKVTATAEGGNATATTVIQAIYQVNATSRDIGG